MEKILDENTLNGALVDYVKQIKCNGIGFVCYYEFNFSSSATYGSAIGLELFDRHGNKYTLSIYWSSANYKIKINKEININNTSENIVGFRCIKSTDNKSIKIIIKSNSWNIINGYSVQPSNITLDYLSTPINDSSNWDNGTDITVEQIVTENNSLKCASIVKTITATSTSDSGYVDFDFSDYPLPNEAEADKKIVILTPLINNNSAYSKNIIVTQVDRSVSKHVYALYKADLSGSYLTFKIKCTVLYI